MKCLVVYRLDSQTLCFTVGALTRRTKCYVLRWVRSRGVNLIDQMPGCVSREVNLLDEMPRSVSLRVKNVMFYGVCALAG